MTATDGPLRIGVVGCGRMADRHARAVEGSQWARIVACCDVVPDAARSYAERYGCERSYTDYAEMVRTHDLDAVLLATWPNQHHEQVIGCLEAGARHILCEKALTLSGGDAYDIWRTARETGAYIMEGFMYRHHPATRLIEEMLVSGDLGPVDHVRAAFSAFDPELDEGESRDWRQRPDRGGGVPYDFACYCVNACNHFNGSRPVRVFGSAQRSQRYDTVSRLYGLIEYENGNVGVVESSKQSVFDQELAILCARGKLRLPISWTISKPPELVVERSPTWGVLDVEHVPVENDDPYRRQLENFAAVVRGQAKPAVPLAESVVNAYTVEALVKGAEQGRSIELDIPTDVLAEVYA